jgi:hypothetical protein
MNRATLAWLAMIWTMFAVWLFIAIPFPVNIGLLAWQCFFGFIVSWLMLIGNKGKE